jgi:putative membrane protein
MDELLKSVVVRPYVFAFLAAFLFLAIRFMGMKRTLIWLVSGYTIAWISEFSSINNGFPYGEYHYLYENMSGELMIAGVPFFDSLSYPFLIFAGFTMASFLLDTTTRKARNDIVHIALGALLTTLLDVIIDPVTKLGSRWFLGEIYYYATPGWYFGIPMSNFAGWFLVSFAIAGFNVFLWKWANWKNPGKPDILYPLFYSSIALFMIAVTFYIGAWTLGVCSSGLLAVVVVPSFRRVLPGRPLHRR